MPHDTPDSAQASRSYWQNHYDEMADHLSYTLFEAEARDYFRRLTDAVSWQGTERVLDFGCGLGFVSERIAAKAGSLTYWDYSRNMLAVAEKRLTGVGQARKADLGDPARDPSRAFDLIVVNSVIQYMGRSELESWLGRWREMLDDEGRLLISDIISPDSSFLKEVRDTLAFSAREGFLIRTLLQDSVQYLRYLRTRKQATMTQYAEDEIRALAERAGLRFEVLPANLTYKQLRYTISLSR